MPNNMEDYVHRIGRAGRAGATGVSHTLITPSDAPFAAEVARMMRRNNQPLPRALQPFARAAERTNAHMAHDGFDSAVCKVASADHERFHEHVVLELGRV